MEMTEQIKKQFKENKHVSWRRCRLQ